MQTYQVLLLSVFISSASSSLKAVNVPELPVDTRPWPYEVYLQSAEVTISENYGRCKTYVRKDKSDNLKKISGYMQLDKQIDCSVKGSMVSMIKSNNIWVENYRTTPKPFDAYVQEMKGPMESFCSHTGMSCKCPVEPGNYTLDKYFMEAELFPRDIQPGEYVITIKFTQGLDEISKMVFFSIVDPVI